tara:strand:- start:925 stop:1827 length:903 start_codon:yes stop_codon:yes gene_type:complete
LKKKIKILIPGGTGFLGYHLALFCKKKGWIIHSLSQFKPKKNRKVPGVKYIFCDIRNKKRLKDKLNNYYDYIVNFSGYVDHSKNKSITKIHFQGCKNLVSNFQNNKPRKFIQIGSSIEYGKRKSPQKEISIRKIDTLSVYGNAKLKSTLFLLSLFKKQSFPSTILRLYLVYGPNQDNNRLIPYVISNSLKGKKFNCSPGNQFRDFTYIKDVITAIYKTIKSKKSNGEVINIGFGRPIKIKDAIQKIVKYVGKGEPIFSKLKIRNDEPLKLYPNINKAKKILNWSPKISFRKGIKKTIKYY